MTRTSGIRSSWNRKWSVLRAPLGAVAVFFVGALAAPAAVPTTNVTITIPAFDGGNYDVNGEHGPTDTFAFAGTFFYEFERDPRRSWFAFHLPNFPGTLTNAMLNASFAFQGSGVQSFELRSVATPVATLRRGGFGLMNVFADLGDGPVFGAFTLPMTTNNLPLNASFLAAATASRGADFAMGGNIPSLNSNSPVGQSVVVYPRDLPRLVLQLSAPAAPTIFAQPSRDYPNLCSVKVGACGALPLSYRWFVDGVPQSAGVSDQICLPVSTATQSVYVIVSNAFGTATSTVAQMRFGSEDLQLNFTNQVVRVDDQPSFWVQSTSQPDFVQWYKNGEPIPQTSSSWTIFAAHTNDSGDYQVVFTGSFGSVTSAVAHLEVVETPPLIWQNPQSATVEAGTWFSEYVTIVGGPHPDIRWFRNGMLLPAETNPWLNFNPTSLADSGLYYFVASNMVGSVTSRVAVILVTNLPPTITGQPSSQTAYFGAAVWLYGYVNSGSPMTVQWYHDGVLLPGTNDLASLYLPYITTSDEGNYYFVASNMGGSVTSLVANLTVIKSPPILSGPDDNVLEAGASLSWYFGLANPPAFVQWYFEGTNLDEPTLTTYAYPGRYFSSVQINQSGHYFIIASNQFGVSTSRVATLTVTGAPPVLSVNASASSVLEGDPVILYVNVFGATPAQVTLDHDNTRIPQLYHYGNGTVETWVYYIASATLADSGDYTVVASNPFGIVTRSFQLTVSRAGPLDKWTIRNPLPQGRDLHGLAWGAGTFVAVGDNGAVVTSPDGTNWTARNSQSSGNLRGVVFGNERFVAAGFDGRALISTNGLTWNAAIIDTNNSIYDVTFGNGNFLAVGYQWQNVASTPIAFRSTNGVDWTPVSIAATSNSYFVSATFGAGRFLAIESFGSTYVSEDLISWTQTVSVVAYGYGSAHVNGRFLALGGDGFMNSSADGVNWESAFYNGVANKNLRSATYGAGRYVVVGAKGKIITSTGDLYSWSSAASATGDRLDRAVFANNVYVAVGENGTIVTSADGVYWTNRTRGVNLDLDGLAVANRLAIAVGKGGTILTSTNGILWNFVPAPSVPQELHGVAFGNGKWLAVGNTTNILSSTNGFNWEVHPMGLTNAYLKSVVYANNLWVAVGEGGLIVTSPDGVVWSVRASPAPYDLNEVTFGDGLFVAVGDGNFNAVVYTSPDGVNWSDHTTYGPGKNARGIAFANGLYVAALNDGVILRTTNAILGSGIGFSNAWEYGATGIEFQDGRNLRGVTWSSNLWVAVGNNGTILTSSNALSWRQRRSPTYENLHAVRSINNTFIAIGNQGVIVQSAPLVRELAIERLSNVVHLTFSSPYEGIHCLQQTADFTWVNALCFTNGPGATEFEFPLPATPTKQFYRVVGP